MTISDSGVMTESQNMAEQGFLEKRVPGLALLLHYDRTQLASDMQAALVVAVVLIPAAFAAADLTGCPPAAGIYASIAGMVVYALFASSRHLNVGPDTAIALLVGSAIEPFAMGDPSKAAMLATILAFLTAAILLLMARLRLG